MRLLILFILLPFVADSQIINASPPYRVKASSCSKLLDQYSGAAAAYSLRLLDCQYAGALIRVRRSSDNTESDINADANGNLDTSALKTFVGTGGTDDGHVVTWYDQAGSYDATQATAGSQPLIIDNGVVVRNDLGSVAINSTSAAGSYLELNPWHAAADTYIWSFSVYSQNGAGNYPYLIGSNPGDQGFIIYHQSNSRFLYTLTNRGGYRIANPSTGYTDDVTLLRSDFANRTTLGIYKDGSSISSVADQNVDFTMPTTYRIAIGPDRNFKICEVIFYNSDQSGNRAGIETAINSYYSIY